MKRRILYTKVVLPIRRCPQRQAVGSSHPEGTSGLLQREEAMLMLTYSELFQFCLVVIGIIGLFLQAKKK